MGIAPDRLDAILAEADERLAGGTRIDDVARAAKEANPGLTITATLTSTMADDPYKEGVRAALYLVDASQHCWVITAEPEKATGIVIALRDEED